MYDYNTVCKALCMYSIEHSFRTVSKNMNISKSIVHLWNKDMKDGIIRNHTRKSRQTKIKCAKYDSSSNFRADRPAKNTG